MKNKIFETEKTKILTWRPKTQYESLSAIIWINEIFGLRIFEFRRRLRYSWSIIYVSVCIVLYFIMYNKVLSHCENSWPAYQEISYKFVLYVNIPIILLCIVLGLVNTENSKKIIARYEQIDNVLESFGIEKDYLKTFIYVIQVISAWCILMVILFILGWIWCWTDTDIIEAFYLNLLLCVPIMINCSTSVTFNTFIRILRDKLHKMNTAISEVHQSSNVNGIDMEYKMQQTAHKFVLVRNCYNQNNFLRRFVEITRQMHFEIIEVTAQTLREIEISCIDGSIKDELQQFSLQLILYPLYFTAAGCVFLDNQLTTKIRNMCSHSNCNYFRSWKFHRNFSYNLLPLLYENHTLHYFTLDVLRLGHVL
ncbi:uncharacterized protein LOC122531266 isoform X3 [Frieseomelitta varia]|uniref:uncharacterized protein LOC122531266 isoform X3 n=1 Tax=Frieseomelitta varia TaxID=561572 RepID=UPI001CB6904C|nr:uncharacterized protein LOC122531266 isoform X3 [Frieseomelitta varia]